jgi:hypothetical protein
MSTGLVKPAVSKLRRYLAKSFDPSNQDPLTDRWVRLASALARAAKKNCIGAQELVVALECAELFYPLRIEGPRRVPGWYADLREVADRTWIPLEPVPDETLSWAESIPESARELLVTRAPLFDCFLSFLIEEEPVFDGLFGHLVRPADQSISRLQAAHTAAAVVAETLRQTLIGQSDAILALTKMAFARSLRQGQQVSPSTALFLGPPGVGKTFAARQFAIGLAASSAASGEVPVLELDMTQFSQWSSTGDLFGEGQKVGCITSFVIDNPECVLIVNEMEKAHRKVLEGFLPILDQGLLASGSKSKRVDFRQAILVFTTNLGSDYWDRQAQPETGSLQVDPMDLLSLAERPDERSEWYKTPVPKELLSRLSKGAIVLFRRPQGHHLMTKIKGSYPLVEVR